MSLTEPSMTTTNSPTVAQTQGAVNEVQDNVDALEARVDTAEGDVDDLETSQATQNANIDAIRYGTSTAAGVQAAITNDKENAVIPPIAAGETVFTDTVNVINGGGGMLIGYGSSDVACIQAYGNTLPRLASVARYNGNKSNPFFRMERADWKVCDIDILGKTQAELIGLSGVNTDIGIKVVRAQAPWDGIGTGKMKFYDVLMAGFNIAIEVGQNVDDENCDESSFYNFVSLYNTEMMRFRTKQAMGFKFYNLRVGITPTVFHYQAGGDLNVFGSFVGHQTSYLKFSNPPLGFGQNVAYYLVKGIKVDNQARNSKIVDMAAGSYYANIQIEAPHFSTTGPVWENEAFLLADHTHLTVSKARNLMANMFRWNCSSTATTITLEDCEVWTSVTDVMDLFDLTNSHGTVRVTVPNLKQYNTYNRLAGLNDVVLTGLA